jgi:DnaJ-class molecular chaperone
MKPIKSDVVEENCPACNGTGFLPVVKQPAPGKRIYPPRCTKCDGKGKVAPRYGTRTA